MSGFRPGTPEETGWYFFEVAEKTTWLVGEVMETTRESNGKEYPVYLIMCNGGGNYFHLGQYYHIPGVGDVTAYCSLVDATGAVLAWRIYLSQLKVAWHYDRQWVRHNNVSDHELSRSLIEKAAKLAVIAGRKTGLVLNDINPMFLKHKPTHFSAYLRLMMPEELHSPALLPLTLSVRLHEHGPDDEDYPSKYTVWDLMFFQGLLHHTYVVKEGQHCREGEFKKEQTTLEDLVALTQGRSYLPWGLVYEVLIDDEWVRGVTVEQLDTQLKMP